MRFHSEQNVAISSRLLLVAEPLLQPSLKAPHKGSRDTSWYRRVVASSWGCGEGSSRIILSLQPFWD